MDCSNFNDYDDRSTPDEPSWMELNQVNKGEAKGKRQGKGFQGKCHHRGYFGHTSSRVRRQGEVLNV